MYFNRTKPKGFKKKRGKNIITIQTVEEEEEFRLQKLCCHL